MLLYALSLLSLFPYLPTYHLQKFPLSIKSSPFCPIYYNYWKASANFSLSKVIFWFWKRTVQLLLWECWLLSVLLAFHVFLWFHYLQSSWFFFLQSGKCLRLYPMCSYTPSWLDLLWVMNIAPSPTGLHPLFCRWKRLHNCRFCTPTPFSCDIFLEAKD